MIQLVLYLSFALTLSNVCSKVYGGAEYYVVPSKDGSKVDDIQCHSLHYYAEHKDQYFVTNSTFYFLPGEHTLLSGDNITVQDISTIKLQAYKDSDVCDQGVQGSLPIVNCSGNQAGFMFINVSDMEIQGIEFTECGQMLFNKTYNDPYNGRVYVDIWSATLKLRFVTNFRMIDARITKSNGYGIMGDYVLGNSSIEKCLLAENKGSKTSKEANTTVQINGGNMQMYYNKSCQDSKSYFYINQTNITAGESISFTSGIDLVLNCPNGGVNFQLNRVILSKNIGYSRGGGNFGVEISVSPNAVNSVSLNDCIIEQGHSHIGSGIFIAIYIIYPDAQEQNSNAVEIENTRFLKNTAAKGVGAGLHVRLYYSGEHSINPVGITLNNCLFEGNRIVSDRVEQRGGIAVNIVTFKVLGNELHLTPQYRTSFKNCIFKNNSILNHTSLSSGVLYFEQHANVTIENCTICDNNSTGIAAVDSYIHFVGTNTVERNTAAYGGGMLLKDNSVMLLSKNTTLEIRNNTAKKAGGGIYAEYASTRAISLCFFQFDADALLNTKLLENIHVNLQNNFAPTGTALYGGKIDECYFLVDNTPWTSKYLSHQHSGHYFNKTFNYTTNPKAISSDPISVCLCEDDHKHKGCQNLKKVKRLSISPGETFKISATVVGQRQGAVSGIIIAEFYPQNKVVNISDIEITQQVKMNCTELTYTVRSLRENIRVNLTLRVPFLRSSVVIVIHITHCPIGFKLYSRTMCECVPKLQVNSIVCTANNHLIHRPAGSWIGYNMHNNSNISYNDSEQIVFKRYCPRLYCKPNKTAIRAFKDHIDQNSQCYLKREGLLCGKCRPGLSIAFGTPRCINCQNIGNWAIFGMLCGFALAGLVLVAILMACNFTVTEGTINGFIFYGNLIEANQDIYFPLSPHDDHLWYQIVRTFIAWLNLDIGTEICFFNGMDTFTKTWLQFLFPIYIWLIAGSLIWLSRKYNFMTRLMKNNGTKVLATLILLSYAKLARVIMVSLSSVSIPPHEEVFWYYDGSVPYFKGKHIPLFLTAIIFIVILSPFTLALLFIKHLPRLSSLWIFHWLNKLKPFFDAYTGPYKDEYRFWTGLQLLIRIILLICTGIHFDDHILLIQIIGVCALLLSANYFYGTGIYKKRLLNILEAFLLLNLTLWSLVTAYYTEKVVKTIYVFASQAFLAFCMVICYHVYKQEHYICACGKLRRCLNKLFNLAIKCKERFTNTPMTDTEGETEESWSERTPILSNAAVPVATYEELSEPLTIN